LPGEYAADVKAVVTLGKHKQQAIREEVQAATLPCGPPARSDLAKPGCLRNIRL
jgi:hypothetical protein